MAVTEPNEKYEALKQNYVKGLPERLSELKSAWSRLQHVSWDPKTLNSMLTAAHKLSGSGGTFKFPRISESAALLEELLEQVLEKPDANHAERRRLEGALRSLENAIEAAVKSAPQVVIKETPTAFNIETAARRLAVIEDDENQADYLKTSLEGLGFHVDTFETPAAFSARASQASVDLVLLDISFPAGPMEGVHWLEQLMGGLEKQIPVIVMSSRSDVVARIRAMRAGASFYLTKPLDMNVLQKRIEQLLVDNSLPKGRVLWVDDDTELLEHYENVLVQEGYEVACLSQPVKILESIDRFQPDAIVLDHEMPGVQGADLAQLLQQDARYMAIPILFVSASTTVSDRLNQSSMAGTECFGKPLDIPRFLHVLEHHLAQAKLIKTRIRLVSQRPGSQGLQHFDFFLSELALFLRDFKLTPPLGTNLLVQAGIDQYEYLRSQHGRVAMARLTTQLESRFVSELGAMDTGCALGTGHFLFRVNHPEAEDTQDFLDDLLQRFNKPGLTLNSSSTPVTVSMGALSLNRAMSEDQALNEVEKACNKALKGKGSCIVWQKISSANEAENPDDRIIQLLEKRAFKLHYQPIVNMESGASLFEALVRLVDDDGVTYLPSQFLPQLTAGKHGALNTLDRWVIDNAILALGQLAGKAAASHSVAIKLTSPMADVKKLIPFISSGLRNARIKGKRRVYLSLPSSSVMQDVDCAREVIGLLSSMDCGMVIEHIEPGPASVDLLKELSTVDFIKLAPEYGASRAHTPELESLVTEIGEIFGSRLSIVATRVEDAKSLSWFWERDIRHFQGYFIQVPELAMDFEL